MGIRDSTGSPPPWAGGNIRRYIAKRWKLLSVVGSHGVVGAVCGVIFDGEVGQLMSGALFIIIGITGFECVVALLGSHLKLQWGIMRQKCLSIFCRAFSWLYGAWARIMLWVKRNLKSVGLLTGGLSLFGLSIALSYISLTSLIADGVGGWGLSVGLFLLGIETTVVYLWRAKRWYSFSEGRGKYGRVVSWQVFLLGLFFALLGAFMDHQVDGSLSIWVLACLWLGLSLWLGLCKRRVITGAFLGMAAFEKKQVVERIKLRLRPISVLSAIGGMTGSVVFLKRIRAWSTIEGLVERGVFWIGRLTLGTPFYHAISAVYHGLKTISTWGTPQLFLGLSTVLHFTWNTALPTLASPWVFFGMVGPAALYLRGYHQVQHWYQQVTRRPSRQTWVLENLKMLTIRGALLVNLVGFFVLFGGAWLGVSPFALGPVLVFTLPFSLIYHLHGHPEYFSPAEIQASSKRLTMMSLSSVVLVLLVMVTFAGPPVVAVAPGDPRFAKVDPTTFEGQLALYDLDLFDPSTGGFKMSPVEDFVTLESTYYGTSLLYRTGYQRLLAAYRQPITAYISRQQEEGGGFGTLENTFYAIQALKMLDTLMPEVAEGAAKYLKASTVGLGGISLSDLHAYSPRLGVVYQAIQLCRALGKPLSEIGLMVLGAEHVYAERAPQVYTTQLTGTTTGEIEPVTLQVEVLDPVTFPLFRLAQEAPRLEFTAHFHLNETLNFALMRDGSVEESRTVDGRTTDRVQFILPFPQLGLYSLSIERPDIMSLEFDNATETWVWEYVETKLPVSLRITTFAPPYAIFPLPSAFEEFSLVVNATQPTELYLTEPIAGFHPETSSLSELDHIVEAITLDAPLAAEAVSSTQLLAGDYYLVAFSSEPSVITIDVQETEVRGDPLGISLREGEPLVQFTEGLAEYSSPEGLLMLSEVYESISEPGFEDMVYDRERVRRELMKFYNRDTYLFEDTGRIEDAYYGFLTFENLEGDDREKYDMYKDGYGWDVPKTLAGPERSLISSLNPAERALAALHHKWAETVNLTASVLDGLAFRPRAGSTPNLKATFYGLMLAERLGNLQKMYYSHSSLPKSTIRQHHSRGSP